MAEDAARLGLKRQERRSFAGIPVVIEYRKGDIRTGKSPQGHVWSRKMKSAYGRIVNTKGADKEPLDVYVGENPHANTVFVVDQLKGPEFKELDEQKFMLGYDDLNQAREAYLENYPDKRVLGDIRSMPLVKFMRYVSGEHAMDPAKLAARVPSRALLQRMERGVSPYARHVRTNSPELIRDSVRDGVITPLGSRWNREPSKEQKVAMDPALSQFVEINLARLSEGKDLEKIANSSKERTGRIVGSLAGIPVGTLAGLALDRSKKHPLLPFMGMAAGQILGGEIGAQVGRTRGGMRKGSSDAMEILRERIKQAGVGGAMWKGFHSVMKSPLLKTKNVLKAGVIGTGALGLYGGYKGIKATTDLAKPYRTGLTQPKHPELGRAF